MKQYRKKPVVIEAEQWHEVAFDREATTESPLIHHLQVGYFRDGVNEFKKCAYCGQRMRTHGWIETLEGGQTICPGDWIIKGIKGEYYPCKPYIFELTYEKVDNA